MKRFICAFLLAALCLATFPLSVGAATNITRVELTLEYPVANKTPQTTATVNGNGYEIYSIDWYDRTDLCYLEAGEKFQSGHSYKATVWVQAKSGYEFSYVNKDTPAITGYINGESVDVYKAFEYNAWAMVCLDYYFSSTPEKGWIKAADLTVPVPVAGEKPSYTQLTGSSYYSSNVYFSDVTNEDMKNGIAWYVPGEAYLDPDTAIFEENNAYAFYCHLFPADGYRFLESAKVTVNGQDAEAKLDYDAFLSVSYIFYETAAHAHTPSAWRTTGIYHYKVCTVCGDMLEQEDHTGGQATCQQDGKCTVCGYVYQEAGEEYHVPDTSKWVARVDMYHYHKCALCGAHCDIEDHRWSPTYLYKDSSGHAWICADCKATSAIEAHDPGPAATDDTPQTCKDCGYILTPALNHTHDLTRVPQTPATCTETGNIEYYFCTGCNDCFTDAEAKNKIPETMSVEVGALGHSTSDAWKYDGSYHWRFCTNCQQVLIETQMVHEMQEGKCATCGYDGTLPQESTAPTSPDAGKHKDPATTGQEDGESDLGWLWVVLVAVAGLAAGVLTTVVLLKKKKK